ncbi:MAG: alpha/beta hydrolase, partial [Steroidobacteraceae bacterium]|nr:alpha/beta hydrolase [Steroidobacteraceae bacterium]
LVLRSDLLRLDLPTLKARYELPNSRYADIDGVRVHYVDEGSGPPVVLVHASFMSLHSWDALAAALRPRYRVIRFDQLGAGLTGPDPANDYSQQHNQRLLDGLTRKLGLERFALLGTSSGGITAFHYAAAHPERVTRLILVNSAGLPRTPATDPNRPRGGALLRWYRSQYQSRAYWRDSLRRQFTSGIEPPAALVDRVYDLNRRDTLRHEAPAIMRAFRTGEPQQVLARVTAPTLILWGLDNITVAHLEADVFQHWLVQAPTLLKKYPRVGHYLYHEIPDEFARDVEAFLSGALDRELRRFGACLPAAASQY